MPADTLTTAVPGQDQQTDGAPQQTPGEPDGTTQTPDTVSRAELEKVIGERQAGKERARKAEARLAEVEKQMAAMPTAERLEAFAKWEAAGADTLREQALKKGDAEAIEAAARKPLVELVDAGKARISSLEAQMTELLCTRAIESAAAPIAHNPKQVVALLRQRVRMTITPDGQFAPEFLDEEGHPAYNADGAIKDAETFVRLFLSLPENANLVKPSAKAGSGARPPGGPAAPQPGTPRSMEEFLALPADRRKAIADAMTPEQRRELMGIPSAESQGFL